MPIELRIQSGARAGQTAVFDKPSVTIGRHPMSDLRFDVKADLDVSTKHGQILFDGGQYTLYDHQSTNGTFVNGTRVPAGGAQVLRNGDTISFGAHGPKATVVISAGNASAPVRPSPPPPRVPSPTPIDIAATILSSPDPVAPPRAPAAAPAPAQPAGPKPRQATGERVAIAVRQQTRKLQLAVIAAVVIIGGGAGAAVWNARSQTARVKAQLVQLAAQVEADHKKYQDAMGATGDTALIHSLKLRADSLTKLVHVLNNENGTAASRAAATAAIQHESQIQQSMTELNAPAVRDANDPAVVLINAEVGTPQEATGFNIAERGVIVTNRHVVQDSTGKQATRIHVKFVNSRQWRPAHIVKVATGANNDLAIIQLDQPGGHFSFTTVANTVDVAVGRAVVTLGFPAGTGTPMDGSDNDALAKTTLTLGTISKIVNDALQLDSYASHGSSGSPVFDAHGHVIGVVYGGIDNRIVFAVPAERVQELLKGVK